jgi:hypothetical protein
MANAIIPSVVAPKRQTFDGCKRQDGQAIVLNKSQNCCHKQKIKIKQKRLEKSLKNSGRIQNIVKRVSWFKSSLLQRITIRNSNEY